MRYVMQISSIVFHPLLILFYGFMLLLVVNPYLFGSANISDQSLLVIKFFVVSFFFPALITAMMVGLKFVPSFQMPDKRDRIFPLIGTMLFYIWLFVNLNQSGDSPRELEILTLGAVLSLVLAFVINTVYKISLHATGMGGLIGIASLLYFSFAYTHFNLPLFGMDWYVPTRWLVILVLLLAGWVMSARLHLKAHSIHEVYWGALLGFTSQWIAWLVYQLI